MATVKRNATNPSGFNLTQAVQVGRTGLQVTLAFLIILMVGRFSWNAFTAYWAATHPEPPPPPTQGFGVLPDIAFGEAAQAPASYTLETSGPFPDFGDRAAVYLMPKSKPSLLGLEESVVIAKDLGFSSEPENLGGQLYRWRITQPIAASLDMDIVNKTFVYSTEYFNRPELILDTDIPTAFDAVQAVKSFVKGTGILQKDIATASGTTRNLKIIANDVTEAVSISDADIVGVELDRYPIAGKFKMYGPDGITGAISAKVTTVRGTPTVISAVSTYYPVDYTLNHTYYLRTPDEAWRLLKAGEGHVARFTGSGTAVVRTVELGYFDDPEGQEYLQPIYVFTGDNNFVGYVTATYNRQP